jgi:hypothetical protein
MTHLPQLLRCCRAGAERQTYVRAGEAEGTRAFATWGQTTQASRGRASLSERLVVSTAVFFSFLINLQFSSTSHSLDDSLRNTAKNEIRLPILRLGAYSGSGGFRAALRRVPSWIRLLSQKKVVRRWAFVSQPHVLDFGPLMNNQ